MLELNRSFEISRMDEELRIVEGIVSTDQVASDGYIVTREAIEEAWPEYMRFGNIREMHKDIAAGVVRSSEMTEAGMMVRVKIVEQSTWEKVKEGVLKAFSIRGPILEAADNIIHRLEIIEISLVDRPADPGALVTMFRAHGLEQTTEGQQAQKEEPMPNGRQALAAQKPEVHREMGAPEVVAGATLEAPEEQAEINIMQELSAHLDAIGGLVAKFNALHDSEAIGPEVLAHCQNAHRSLGKAMGAHIKASTSYGAKDDGEGAPDETARAASIVPHKPGLSRMDRIEAAIEKLTVERSEKSAGYQPVVIPETPVRVIDKAGSVTRSDDSEGDGFPATDSPEFNALPELERFQIIDTRQKNLNRKAQA